MRFLPAVWDITPVYDRDTREVFVLFAGPGRQLGEPTDIFVVSSRDFGLSWSAPANLSSSCGGGMLTPGDGVRKNASSEQLMYLYIQRSFCQDRLGTSAAADIS
jgi:hypothetical protein